MVAVAIIQTNLAMQAARRIRQEVFVEEQQVDPAIEYDEFEQVATHVLALVEGQPLGTARYRSTATGYKLERFAVLKSQRHQGVGAALLRFILAQLEHDRPIYLNSQVSAIGFYEHFGFQTVGDIFYEAKIPHRKMVLMQDHTEPAGT